MKREQVDFVMSSNIKLDFSQLLTSKLRVSSRAPVEPLGCANRIELAARQAGRAAPLSVYGEMNKRDHRALLLPGSRGQDTS